MGLGSNLATRSVDRPSFAFLPPEVSINIKGSRATFILQPLKDLLNQDMNYVGLDTSWLVQYLEVLKSVFL